MSPRTPTTNRKARATRQARRVWPILLAAYERWQALPPEKREQYLRQAREYAQRARTEVEKRRPRRR
jgi:TRAP-type C4-dicarboxylate transport system substrate-binding protein